MLRLCCEIVLASLEYPLTLTLSSILRKRGFTLILLPLRERWSEGLPGEPYRTDAGCRVLKNNAGFILAQILG